jgi:hypothetical protein
LLNDLTILGAMEIAVMPPVGFVYGYAERGGAASSRREQHGAAARKFLKTAVASNRVPVPKHTPHKSTHKFFGKITPHFNNAP